MGVLYPCACAHTKQMTNIVVIRRQYHSCYLLYFVAFFSTLVLKPSHTWKKTFSGFAKTVCFKITSLKQRGKCEILFHDNRNDQHYELSFFHISKSDQIWKHDFWSKTFNLHSSAEFFHWIIHFTKAKRLLFEIHIISRAMFVSYSIFDVFFSLCGIH